MKEQIHIDKAKNTTERDAVIQKGTRNKHIHTEATKYGVMKIEKAYTRPTFDQLSLN